MSYSLFVFVRNSIDIVDVVSHYVALKPAGAYLKGLSPFKPEKTASFTVSPHKKIFYCFSTNQGGDVVDFISKLKKISQLEAAQELIDQYNLIIPKELLHTNNTRVSHRELDTLHFFAQWCHQKLFYNLEASTYLKSRKLSQETIKQFMVGYCPQTSTSLDDLIATAQKEGYLIDDLLSADILQKSNKKYGVHSYYIPYEDRIIFPINDNNQKIIGFGSRIFRLNDSRCKYYNSHTNETFSKKKTLYGLPFARPYIQKENKVFLVEGYMDTLHMHQNGYHNTVATMGTACTEEHIDILSKHTPKIICLYDGDNAGQQAILKLSKLCWDKSIELDIVELPENEDPASICEKNLNHNSFFQNQLSSISFFIKKIEKDYPNNSLKEKIVHISDLLKVVNQIKDHITQSIMLSEISSKLQISMESLEKIMKHEKFNIENKQKVLISEPSSSENEHQKDLHTVCLLIAHLISAPNMEHQVLEEIIEILHNIDNMPWIKPFLDEYLKKKSELSISQHNQIDFDLLNFFDTLEESYKNILVSILIKNQHCEIPIFLIIREIKKQRWKNFIANIKGSSSNILVETEHHKTIIDGVRKYYGNQNKRKDTN